LRPFVFLTIASLLVQPVVPQERPTFSTSTNLVIVDITVLGRDAKPVENLTRDDFELYEDGKLQQLQGCDLQRLDTKVLPTVNPPMRPLLRGDIPPPATPADTARDHRLIILLFDFSSMQPAEQIRTADAAVKFLSTQMTLSDLVSIMVFASSLQTVQDFTADRDLLISTIQQFHIGDSSELASLGDTGPDPEDESGLFVADETEFNIFNTDRKLAALENAARKLSTYPQKKALVYFSGGVEKTGVDNQSQLRATINTALRSNVAFYTIDVRGLMASAPGGDAAHPAPVGSKLYSGAGQRALSDSFHNQQETLYSLAADTGGKALLDSNDLTLGITQVQKDIASYYVLSYASSNQAEDGRYRHIQVKVSPRLAAMRLKLGYRPGYFAPAIFAKMSSSDREARLQQALESDNPLTDLPIAVEVDHFRLAKDKYFVPVSVKIPGSALSFRSKGRKAATELDFIAEVRDARHRVASVVRDTIPLKLDDATAGRVGRKQIQYDTGLTLAPGKYTLRFVARENGEGKVGTFETPFTIPDLSAGNALRLSSVILSNQREALKEQIAAVKNDKKLLAENPLIDRSGRKIVPNVTRVFRSGQNLFVYLEVYDPVMPENPSQDRRIASVAANLALFSGTHKVMETPQVHVNRLDSKRENVLPMRLTVQFNDLKSGKYTCQVNVIDELGRKFAFPRTPLFVVAAEDVGTRAPVP
jgi:VWFA-related protein